MSYKKVLVEKGRNGWGTPLTIAPKEGQKIVCITAGSLQPIAKKIAELTGAPLVDGKTSRQRRGDCLCYY